MADNSGRTFSADLQKFCDKTRIKADTFVRKVTLDLFGEVVQRTPVDTGMARANWQIGIGERPEGTVDDAARMKRIKGQSNKSSYDGGRAAMAGGAMANFSNIQAGGVNYIVNNLPYIMKLEDGTSQQAPQGMARIAVANFQAIVNAALRSI
jgi:hypothetical protein